MAAEPDQRQLRQGLCRQTMARVGWRHVEIGLEEVFTNMALSRLRRGLLCVLEGEPRGSPLAQRSLNTLLDIDLVIIEDACQAEHRARSAVSMRHSSTEEMGLHAYYPL